MELEYPNVWGHVGARKLFTFVIACGDVVHVSTQTLGSVVGSQYWTSVCGGTAQAQSTVAELAAQGGTRVSKDDFLSLIPIQIQTQWPNGQGEEELFFSADNKISGKGYHYGSRSESAANGTWKVEEDGRVCTPRTFSAWNSSTNLCWYFFKLGDNYFAAHPPEPGNRIGRINAMGKVASPQ